MNYKRDSKKDFKSFNDADSVNTRLSSISEQTEDKGKQTLTVAHEQDITTKITNPLATSKDYRGDIALKVDGQDKMLFKDRKLSFRSFEYCIRHYKDIHNVSNSLKLKK